MALPLPPDPGFQYRLQHLPHAGPQGALSPLHLCVPSTQPARNLARGLSGGRHRGSSWHSGPGQRAPPTPTPDLPVWGLHRLGDELWAGRRACGKYTAGCTVEVSMATGWKPFPISVEIAGAPLRPPFSFLSRKHFKQDLHMRLRQTWFGLTPAITSLTRDFPLRGNAAGGLVGMETIRGNSGALLCPCEVSWDGSLAHASPATLDLTSSDRIPSGERSLQASVLSSCWWYHVSTTASPAPTCQRGRVQPFTNTCTKTQILLQSPLPVAACAETLLPNGVSVILFTTLILWVLNLSSWLNILKLSYVCICIYSNASKYVLEYIL